MRRFRLFLSMVVVVVLGIVVIGARPAAVAQGATPAAEEMEGLTFAPIGFAQGVPLPSLPT
jgi:hypothetical protein